MCKGILSFVSFDFDNLKIKWVSINLIGVSKKDYNFDNVFICKCFVFIGGSWWEVDGNVVLLIFG